MGWRFKEVAVSFREGNKPNDIVHVAIDRLTGKVIDKQIEVVNE